MLILTPLPMILMFILAPLLQMIMTRQSPILFIMKLLALFSIWQRTRGLTLRKQFP